MVIISVVFHKGVHFVLFFNLWLKESTLYMYMFAMVIVVLDICLLALDFAFGTIVMHDKVTRNMLLLSDGRNMLLFIDDRNKIRYKYLSCVGGLDLILLLYDVLLIMYGTYWLLLVGCMHEILRGWLSVFWNLLHWISSGQITSSFAGYIE